MTPAWFFSSSEINPADCGCGSGALTSSFGGSGLLAWPMACPMRLWTNPLCKMAPAWSFNPSGINPVDSGFDSGSLSSFIGLVSWLTTTGPTIWSIRFCINSFSDSSFWDVSARSGFPVEPLITPPMIFIRPEKSSAGSLSFTGFWFRFLEAIVGWIPEATVPRMFWNNPPPKKLALSPETLVAELTTSSTGLDSTSSASSGIILDICFFNSGRPAAFFLTICLTSMTFLSNRRRSREESLGDGCIRTLTIASSRLAMTEESTGSGSISSALSEPEALPELVDWGWYTVSFSADESDGRSEAADWSWLSCETNGFTSSSPASMIAEAEADVDSSNWLRKVWILSICSSASKLFRNSSVRYFSRIASITSMASFASDSSLDSVSFSSGSSFVSASFVSGSSVVSIPFASSSLFFSIPFASGFSFVSVSFSSGSSLTSTSGKNSVRSTTFTCEGGEHPALISPASALPSIAWTSPIKSNIIIQI